MDCPQSRGAVKRASMNKPSVTDEAQMRQEFRRLYREVGWNGCLQVLYEFLKSAEWLAEIMVEEGASGR